MPTHGDHSMKLYDARGEKNSRAKLTTEQVMAIRQAFSMANDKRVARAQLAGSYQLSRSHLNNILRGRRWSHVPEGAA